MIPDVQARIAAKEKALDEWQAQHDGALSLDATIGHYMGWEAAIAWLQQAHAAQMADIRHEAMGARTMHADGSRPTYEEIDQALVRIIGMARAALAAAPRTGGG